MSEERKKPDTLFWTAIVLVALVAYPLSWGPAYRFCDVAGGPEGGWLVLSYVYFPMRCAVGRSPEWLRNALESYYYWWNPHALDAPPFDPETDAIF
jgi:hypothetical protein